MAKGPSNNQPENDQGALPLPEQEPASTAASSQDAKNPAAVELGRLGGKKGGPARARKLNKEQRIQIARKAAQARWAKRRQP